MIYNGDCRRICKTGRLENKIKKKQIYEKIQNSIGRKLSLGSLLLVFFRVGLQLYVPRPFLIFSHLYRFIVIHFSFPRLIGSGACANRRSPHTGTFDKIFRQNVFPMFSYYTPFFPFRCVIDLVWSRYMDPPPLPHQRIALFPFTFFGNISFR